MSRRATYHHGDLRSALLSAGRDLLAERGPDAFSLSALAHRVGVSTAAPYRHFADRNALLDALADEGYTIFHATLLEAVASATDPGDALRRIGLAYLNFADERAAVFRIMFQDRQGRPAEAGPPAFTTFYDAVVRAQESGYLPAQHSAVAMTRSIWAGLHGAAALRAAGGFAKLDIDVPPAQLVDELLAPLLLTPGLSPQTPLGW